MSSFWQKILLVGILGLLSACAAPQSGLVARGSSPSITLPSMKLPAGARAPATTRSNASIARDFLALTFSLESGRPLPTFTRFEGPITLRTTGMALSAVSQRDLDQLIARFGAEAGIRIRRVSPDQPASISVEILPRKTMQRLAPDAACFVAPSVSSWAELAARRGRAAQDWLDLRTRRKMAIFIPGDIAPQEIRDCLHEEIAQSIGPVNDLYRLTDSIFNDDNFQAVLTGFDMLVLRAYYDPALQSGMTQNQVAARLPAILARINPAGRRGRDRQVSPTTRDWIAQIQAALGARSRGAKQIAAAKRAVALAREKSWNDNRLGFSLYALGRLTMARDTPLALASFAQAQTIFAADPSTRLHAAHVSVQLAAYTLSAGRAAEAIAIVDANSPTALAAENASLLSALLLIKAQALDTLRRPAQAQIVRLDALGWARYGLGSDAEIRRRMTEIAALSPPSRRSPAT
jgi:Protein of unknown function (DUF2927)